MTGQEVVDEILAEIAALGDTDLNTLARNGMNWARRQIQNIKGGKMRWLLKRWDVIATADATQFITFETDLRIVRVLWNETSDAELAYHQARAYRDENGVQLSTDARDEPGNFTLDTQRDTTTGALRAELWPICDGVYNLRPYGWRKLEPIALADLANEIVDMPSELHEHLVTGGRFYGIRRLSRGASLDLIRDAREDWGQSLSDVAAFDSVTSLESTRVKSAAEIQREVHRTTLGFDREDF